MPKSETLAIQEYIVALGEKLGFIAELETKVLGAREYYSPVCDVAWYLDLDSLFNMDAMKLLLEESPQWLGSLKKIPFAGFEIEGSTTSSKNQLSNFANLYASRFLFKFVIVNNEAAGKENDTYRRGVKINRYFRDRCGQGNVVFADWIHIQKSSLNLRPHFERVQPTKTCGQVQRREGCGGETKSIVIYETLLPFLKNTGMLVRQNYAPQNAQWEFILQQEMYQLLQQVGADFSHDNSEALNFYLQQKVYHGPNDCASRIVSKVSDVYYIPKLDVVAGIESPRSFLLWLEQLGQALNFDCVYYPLLFALTKGLVRELYLPLVSMEIETSVNKHLNGGIINMSRNSFCGVLAAPREAVRHLQMFRENMACNNIVFYGY